MCGCVCSCYDDAAMIPSALRDMKSYQSYVCVRSAYVPVACLNVYVCMCMCVCVYVCVTMMQS